MTNLWHVTIASISRFSPFPEKTDLKMAIRDLYRTLGPILLLFSVVDDHIHMVLDAEKKVVGYRLRSLHKVLKQRTGFLYDESRFRLIEDRKHLTSLIGYCLNQASHHGLTRHPELWEGSCFPDLIGVRAISTLGVPLTKHLPRLKSPDYFLQAFDLPLTSIYPICDEQLEDCTLQSIVEAVSDLYLLDTNLAGKFPDACNARRTLAHLTTCASIPSNDVTSLLQVSNRTFRRWLEKPVDTDADRKVRTWMSLKKNIMDFSPTARPVAGAGR